MLWLINKILSWRGVPQEHELLDNLTREQVAQFAQDARAMKSLGYFKWFIEDMELLSERKMFSGDKDMQLFGKGILYCLEMMKGNVSKMAEGKIQIDSPEKKKMTRFI